MKEVKLDQRGEAQHHVGLGFAGVALAALPTATVSIQGSGGSPTAPVTGKATLGVATGLSLSTNGIGHTLLVPYFSTQNGNVTLLNIVNTDPVNGKAVKVRFRGAANSDDLLDFQVFLSPNDMWTASVSQNSSGVSVLNTSDTSCTQPAIPAAGQPFGVGRLPSTVFTTTALQNAQTLEGYVEILTMANIPAKYADGQKHDYADALSAGSTTTTASTTNALYTAVLHTAGVAPCTASVFSALEGTEIGMSAAAQATASAATAESDAVSRGLDSPTTGLTGSWSIVNVAGAAVAWTGLPTAVVATASGAATTGNIVFSPQSANTSGAQKVATLPQTNDPLMRIPSTTAGTPVVTLATAAKIVAAQNDLPDLSTPYYGAPAATSAYAQAMALSGSIAAKAVINEYFTDSSVSAATDWVFSSPTRRYSVAVDYSAKNATTLAVQPAALFTDSGTFGANQSNASTYYTAANSTMGTGAQAALLCVTPSASVNSQTAVYAWDREEQQQAPTGVVFSPAPATPNVQFCGETSVLSYNAGGTTAPSVLSAVIARGDVETGYLNGWSMIRTDGLNLGGTGSTSATPLTAAPNAAYVLAQFTAAAGSTGSGLPVLGASFEKAVGPKANNFSITLNHRFQ